MDDSITQSSTDNSFPSTILNHQIVDSLEAPTTGASTAEDRAPVAVTGELASTSALKRQSEDSSKPSPNLNIHAEDAIKEVIREEIADIASEQQANRKADIQSEPSEQTDELPSKGIKIYEVDDTEVNLKWKTCTPTKEGEQADSSKAVVFLSGWSMKEGAKSTEKLSQAFADESRAKTYSIDTRANRILDDSLMTEAEAVRRFLVENGVKELTIVGHSQGGIEGINLVTLLQEKNPDVKINGIVLIESVGMYDQGRFELVRKFVQDSLLNTPVMLAKKLVSNREVTKAGLSATNDVMAGIGNEIAASKLNYVKKLINQVSEMAGKNARLEKVRVPVVLMQGESDPVSAHERIVPKENQEIQDATADYVDPREQYLRDTIFPNSPYVKMVIPEKLGHHGLPLFRSKSVARASLYLLNRYSRQHDPATMQTQEAIVA